ncbi:prolyl oligopeptidase family serine peptidase [Sulfolobus sp. E5-1-F]|uniref:alpha/beta hydrolase family protein n=1 Tax=Saccharolobus sp. E5-1-F TaxID=2663019 RepID=UPI001297096D|nr:YqiA/YcfP family alpha/beta fold hydrolase [Sulfolobus sp. E5-1-F]QGA55337.1 prolyl oligopeptidase family serine peptidase [Sulfolobus sp. E5-1-F]
MGFNNIAFLGFSLGGEMALWTFEKFRNIVKALVLFAPGLFAEGPRSNWISKQDGYRYSPFGPFRLKEEVANEMKVNLLHIADKIDVPILIVHSKDDEVLDFRVSVEFYNRVKSTNKQIILFDKGGHTFYDYEVRQRLYKEVTEWLVKRLK